MYATQQDIEKRYGKEALLIIASTDDGDEVDSEKVQEALSDANDEINLYIGKQHALPLDTIPTVLTRLAVEIALYYLSVEEGSTEERHQRYKDSINTLKAISDGRVSLGIAQDDENSSPVGQEVEMTSEVRMFTRKNNRKIF